MDGSVFALDHYLIKQTSYFNTWRYHIQDEVGNNIAYATATRLFSLKPNIQVFTDDSKSKLLFSFQKNKIFSFFPLYTVIDNMGNTIGKICREFTFFKITFKVIDKNGMPIGRALEETVSMIIGGALKSGKSLTNFDIFIGDKNIGRCNRSWATIKDSYDLTIFDDSAKALDRRLVLALAIILDVDLGR